MAIQNPLGPRPGGTASALNITLPTVIKADPGTCYRVSVNSVSAVSVSACYDAVTTSATTMGVTAANLFWSVAPSAGGVYELEWPCANGIVAVPGTGAVISISYS